MSRARSMLEGLERRTYGYSAIAALSDDDLQKALAACRAGDMGALLGLFGKDRVKRLLAEVDGQTRGLPREWMERSAANG